MSSTGSETENRNPIQNRSSVSERAVRLRRAIEAAGGNAVVSNRSGVPKGSLSNYLQGRDMKAATLVAIADACGVTLDWLLRGETDHSPADKPLAYREIIQEETLSIPVPFLQSEASAGTGIEPVEWGRDVEVSVPIDFLHSLIGFIPKQIFFMKVRGDSMTPTIHTGDTVIINYTQSPLRDGIYAISVNGMAMIKRIGMKSPKTYSIISDNPFYERFDVSIKDICWGTAQPDAEVRVIGRVIGNFHLENDASLPG